MRIASVGQVVFAATMIGLGILGMVQGNFPPVWQPVPNGVPAREALVYLCCSVSLVTGIGLLWRRAADAASRLLFAWLVLWFFVFRVPEGFSAPTALGSWYGCAELAVMVAAAWVLYAWFAGAGEGKRSGFAAGSKGVRGARVLYGAALIYFGVAQFVYLKETVADVPKWMAAPTAWAYFSGCAFVLAGLAIWTGVYGRLAAALSAVEIGLLTLLVWVPIFAAGTKDPFQRSETILSAALTAGAWMVADSYRGMPWFAVNKR